MAKKRNSLFNEEIDEKNISPINQKSTESSSNTDSSDSFDQKNLKTSGDIKTKNNSGKRVM